MRFYELEGTDYEIVDVKERINLVDSFAVTSNKLQAGTGSGEATIYLGTVNKAKDFFDDLISEGFLSAFILKNDILKYLNEIELEVMHPTQNYRNAGDMRRNFQSIRQELIDFPEVITFSLNATAPFDNVQGAYADAQHRVYTKSDARPYDILRKLALPNYSYLSVMKLNSTSGNRFYLKINSLIDYNAEEIVETIIEENTEIAVPSVREREIITTARIGQSNFRLSLLDEYDSTCPMTGIDEPKLLVASHIKPWRYSSNTEKVSSKNGILLSATFDKLFDQGFITFTDDSALKISNWLSNTSIRGLGLVEGQIYANLLLDEHRKYYLNYHRLNIFQC